MRTGAAIALALAASGCVGPIAPAIEAGPAALLAHTSTPTEHETGVGFRSEIAAGIVPPERTGPVAGLEGLGSYDTARGTQWSVRVRGGYSFALPYRMALAPELDAGTRLDDGLFYNAFEGGVRLGLVVPLSPVRSPQDRSNAFVFLSESVDLTAYGRFGIQLARGRQDTTDASIGLALRAWFFSDLL